MARPLRSVRRLSEVDKRELMTKQAALSALTKHPSWPSAIEVVDEKVHRLEREAITRVFSAQGLEPEYGRYLRGFRDGMRYFIRICEGAEDRLETILKQTSEGE